MKADLPKADAKPSRYRKKNVGHRANSREFSSEGEGKTGAATVDKKRDVRTS